MKVLLFILAVAVIIAGLFVASERRKKNDNL